MDTVYFFLKNYITSTEALSLENEIHLHLEIKRMRCDCNKSNIFSLFSNL